MVSTALAVKSIMDGGVGEQENSDLLVAAKRTGFRRTPSQVIQLKGDSG